MKLNRPPVLRRHKDNDTASCSRVPSLVEADKRSHKAERSTPQGLTNDDEVGVQSTDGVPDSRVHVKLPSDRRESKFNRSFPSVDELDGSAF